MRRGIWQSIANCDHIHVRITPHLPAEAGGGALVRRSAGQIWILLGADLNATERRAVLAHEIVHLERGTTRHHDAPTVWAFEVAREERRVDQEVARRLVPVDELEQFIAERAAIDEPVTTGCIAERFDVPWHVAETAALLDPR